MKCVIHPSGSLNAYKYVVVFASINDQWLFCKHKGRDTWETAGGHIEPSETPEGAAQRELYEETGVTRSHLRWICDYWAGGEPQETDNIASANGAVFLADVQERGIMPESEMACAALFDGMPQLLTYPGITPVLFEAVKSFISQ